MSTPNPFDRPGLAAALERYRYARHAVSGLGPEPCAKADLEYERACAADLAESHGCQFGWPYDEPFDPAFYRRRRPFGPEYATPPDPPGVLRVGMVVFPEVFGREGLRVAHAIVEPVGDGDGGVRRRGELLRAACVDVE